ncbi:Fic family protein [bacterium]|nr:Fic family protein [bacterium]
MPRVPLRAPTLEQAFDIFSVMPASELARLFQTAEAEPGGKYRHWHTFRNLTMPDGFSAEQMWAGVKFQREPLSRPLGDLVDLEETPFKYARSDGLLERLHNLDQLIAGHVGVATDPWPTEQRERYIVRNFIEEAIASSQLEGASTTRIEAKEMIRHNREPTDRAERMILNNYRAILRIAETKEEPITPELILELHSILTDGTLDNPDAVGRFQTPDDGRIVVGGSQSLEPEYRPPPAEAIPALIDSLCQFANEEAGPPWIHPLVRAVALHFMLGWIHPFEDGNGRVARALFYWAAMKADYWILEYLSISKILLRAPGQYAMSFLETETDQNDVTYFILYQLDAIQRAVNQLFEYARRQADRTRQIRGALKDLDLNHRQEALLGHALIHPDAQYTFYSHAAAHRVVRLTARSDILELEGIGLLVRSGKVGRADAFIPSAEIHDLIEELTHGS